MIQTNLRLLFLIIILSMGNLDLRAQYLNRDSTNRIFMINLSYGGYQPGGDMSDRFGFTNIAGGEIGYKFRAGIYISGGMHFMFGSDVREELHMDNLKYNGQTILNFNGSPAEIRTWQRGYTIPVRVGWIFPRLDPFQANSNSGPYIELGTQFIQHKIRVEDIGNQVPSLNKIFKPGYDRLTNGMGIMQSIGYRYFATNKLVNFFIAMEFMQNFTESRRDVQYDVAEWNPAPRKDFLIGIRGGWSIPIYRMTKSTYFYF